ncbi:MAG: squalene/phytoene synthase family protein [Verrucomicrobia bacterium]|jgi:phytoene synthase|nr:squalene/phytoene synthase family protein [Verrucomicrobiota bacterium]
MDTSASPKDLFRRNSRSFSLAARFFSPDDQMAVARLYQFCRYLDDLADDTTTGDQTRLNRARERLTNPNTAPADSVEFDFIALSEERSIPLGPALDLIDALHADCGERSIRDEAGLIQFAYGVAGTVGRMMRHVIDARDERADAFAIDLGIGLQLSNVIRDVAEDAQRGRYYLPAAWVEPETIRRAMGGEAGATAAVDTAVQRTHDLAEDYYQSARRGFVYIPERNRRVIFLAAAFYQAIGQKVVRQSPGGWRQRTVVGPLAKLAILLRAPVAYRRWKRLDWLPNPEPLHDATLHEAFAQSNLSG